MAIFFCPEEAQYSEIDATLILSVVRLLVFEICMSLTRGLKLSRNGAAKLEYISSAVREAYASRLNGSRASTIAVMYEDFRGPYSTIIADRSLYRNST